MLPSRTKLLQACFNLFSLIRKGVITQVWAIMVFSSEDMISKSIHEFNMSIPTLQASDVNDVNAEFVADPFITRHDSRFYMFFEVLNKKSGRGEIAVAESIDGARWDYKQVVLRESFHLSYPQVFQADNEIYMLPETSEANQVLLYKAKQFPLQWEAARSLFDGRYLDPSIIHHNGKWWIFTGTEGKNLHLFYSEQLDGPWMEHPRSPMITNDVHISRPGGRVIANGEYLYRYTQNGYPSYGNSVKLFRVHKLSEHDYEEEEVSLILSGTDQAEDWRRDGMHHIDQLKLDDKEWLVAVDGHRAHRSNYFVWKLGQMKHKLFS